ncbi:hypothetical protein ACERK3_01520 [Phycisphaerales bacterium AB-hyl4]|uniref:Uncharacterized protein n=1 Tax=Natronomicrosphaera hydrolytica TaxID=3242702 RepID=A0ABV4U0R5_9BACT
MTLKAFLDEVDRVCPILELTGLYDEKGERNDTPGTDLGDAAYVVLRSYYDDYGSTHSQTDLLREAGNGLETLGEFLRCGGEALIQHANGETPSAHITL